MVEGAIEMRMVVKMSIAIMIEVTIVKISVTTADNEGCDNDSHGHVDGQPPKLVL